jgi:hypothetical protein
MGRSVVSQRVRQLVLAGLVGLLVAGGVQAAHANPNELALEVLSVQASLAPDGRSMSFDLLTRCDRRATVLDARVSAVQPQASGEASFTPSCTRLPQVVGVTVPSLDGSFQTGEAQVSALLVVREGKTKQVQDSALVRVRPSVSVRLADQALLEGGGQAVLIDVSVTCPVSSNGQGGQVAVYQGQVVGRGAFGPTACDGLPHTLLVRVETSAGLFQVGSAEAEAFASVEEGGDIFPGADLRTVGIVQA